MRARSFDSPRSADLGRQRKLIMTVIADVTVQPLNLALTEPFAVAQGAPTSARNVLVRVVLQDGTVGLGEAAPFTEVSGETQEATIEAIRSMRSSVIGHNVRDWQVIGSALHASHLATPAARAGLEIAIVDAFARATDLPLWKLFGSVGTVLTTDMTVTAGDVPHAQSSARKISELGITTIKVKVGASSAEEDIARMIAIRNTAPQARLFADANTGYDLSEAIAFVHGVEAAGIKLEVFEQPLARGNHDQWKKLAAATSIPLCADESARSVADVEEIAAAGAAKFINIKTMKSGVAEAYAMMQTARDRGLSLMIGGMVESILAMSFSAHLAAGFGGITIVDLDTPMFILSHPFSGGFEQKGERLDVSHVRKGHGVTLRA
ncbi:MAG: dipeptide epimerase [Clostridia bacterium]|nr:dipeptide epimerase [Deltaproteobacteria bacterium]